MMKKLALLLALVFAPLAFVSAAGIDSFDISDSTNDREVEISWELDAEYDIKFSITCDVDAEVRLDDDSDNDFDCDEDDFVFAEYSDNDGGDLMLRARDPDTAFDAEVTMTILDGDEEVDSESVDVEFSADDDSDDDSDDSDDDDSDDDDSDDDDDDDSDDDKFDDRSGPGNSDAINKVKNEIIKLLLQLIAELQEQMKALKAN